MAGKMYTEDYIQKLIDDNNWAVKPKEPVKTETWERAPKSSTQIPASSRRNQYLSEGAQRRSANQAGSDQDMVNKIRTYTAPGYQMTAAEEDELKQIRSKAIESSSKAGRLVDDTVVLPGGTILSEAERRSLIDGSAYETLRDYEAEPVTSADIEKWLSDGYEMTDTEKRAAKEAAGQYFDNLNIGSMSTEEQIALTNGENEEYNRMRRLQNKTSGLASFATGLLDLVRPALAGIGNLLNSDQYDRQLESLNQATTDARTQNPVAYGAGDMAMNMATYSAAQGALNQIPALNNLGKSAANAIGNALGGGQRAANIARGAINVLGDTGLDMLLDVAPSAYMDRANGLTDEQVRNNALANIGLSLGGNVLGEVGGNLINNALSGRAARRAAGETVEQAAKNTDDVIEQAAKNADDQIENLEQAVREAQQAAANVPGNDDVLNTLLDNQPRYMEMEGAIDDVLDLADNAQRIKSVPKTTVPKTSRFSTLDKEVSKLVRMYGDDSVLDDLTVFRNAIVEFENTGSVQAADNASRALGRLDDALKGRTYTDGATFTRSGAQKRAGTTYTYGQEYAGISDLMDDARDQFDAVFQSKGTFDNQIPQLAQGVQSVNEIRSLDDALTFMGQQSPDVENTRIPNLEDAARQAEQMDAQNLDTVNAVFAQGQPAPDAGAGDNAAPGTKTSKTRTNTMPGTGIMTDDEMAAHAAETLYQYTPVSERESVARAVEMIQRDGAEATMNNLLNKESLSGSDMDALMGLWRSTVQNAQAADAIGADSSALWEQAQQIFKKVQTQSTNNAQALQALAKWSRSTPEGMLAEAERIVNGRLIKKREVNNVQKTLDRQLKRSLPQHEFSADFQKKFLNLAEQISRQTDMNSREARELMGQIGKLVSDEVPAKFGAKVKRQLMNNMLGNFRTLIARNAGGNLGFNAVEQFVTKPVAAGIDRIAALKTGKRTTAGLSMQGIGEYAKGFAGGIKDESLDIARGVHTARTGDNTLINAIDANKRVYRNPVQNAYDEFVRHGLSIGDRPFYEATYRSALSDMYRMREKGWLGNEIQELSDEGFKEYAEAVAKDRALQAVYQSTSKLSQGLSDIKKGLGNVSEGVVGADLLTQTSMPFVTTPANIVERSIEYSPFGAVKNLVTTAAEAYNKKHNNGYGIDQARLAMETARNLVGTGIFGAGYLAAQNGLMSGGYSDDQDMRNAQKASGMQEYALDTGDGYLDLSWVPVVGNSLIAGAGAYDAVQDNQDANPIQSLGEGTSAGLEQLMGGSLFQGMNRIFGSENSYSNSSSIPENVVNAVKSGITQLEPSLMGQVAKSLDEYEREVYNSNTDSALNSFVANIPVLRENLQPKVNNEGELMKSNQGRSLGSRLFENMISPARYTEKVSSPINDEAMRLFESTGNNYAFVPTAKRDDLKTDSGEMPTDEEFREYRQSLGTLNSENAEALINSSYYKALSDEEKEAELQDLYSAMKAVARTDAVDGYETDNKLASAYMEYGGDFMQDYMEANSAARGISGGEGFASVNWQEALRAVNQNPDLTAEMRGRLLRFRKENEKTEEVFSRYGNEGVYDFYSAKARADSDGDGDVNTEEFIPFLMNSNMSIEKRGDYLIFSGCADIDSDSLSQIYSELGSEGVYHYKAATSVDYDGDGSKSKEDVMYYLDNADLSPVQKAYIFSIKYPKAKYNPYN